MRINQRWSLTGMLLMGRAWRSRWRAARAREKGKKPPEKHDAGVLSDTLKEVIDAGAKIFNDQGDHAGCYQLWRGSLMSIKPFVPPDLQNSIDRGLVNAEKKDTYADRAFELRKILDEVRAKSAGKKQEEKKDDKKDDKKKKKKDDVSKGNISGQLLFQNQPVPGGYFVTLVSKNEKAFSSAIQRDGRFQFKTPIPMGDYRVAIEKIPTEEIKGPPLPVRYHSIETSTLAVQVHGGTQEVELKLVK